MTRNGLLGQEKPLTPLLKANVRLREAIGSLLVCVGVVWKIFLGERSRLQKLVEAINLEKMVSSASRLKEMPSLTLKI